MIIETPLEKEIRADLGRRVSSKVERAVSDVLQLVETKPAILDVHLSAMIAIIACADKNLNNLGAPPQFWKELIVIASEMYESAIDQIKAELAKKNKTVSRAPHVG